MDGLATDASSSRHTPDVSRAASAGSAEHARFIVNFLGIRKDMEELAAAYLRNMPSPQYDNALLTMAGGGEAHRGFCDLAMRRLERLLAAHMDMLYPEIDPSEMKIETETAPKFVWEPFAEELAREWMLPGKTAELRAEYRITAGYADLAMWMGMLRIAEIGKLGALVMPIMAEREIAWKNLMELRKAQFVQPVAANVARQVEELRYSK